MVFRGRWVRGVPIGRAVVGAVSGLDTGHFEELPNEFTALGPVVIEGPA